MARNRNHIEERDVLQALEVLELDAIDNANAMALPKMRISIWLMMDLAKIGNTIKERPNLSTYRKCQKSEKEIEIVERNEVRKELGVKTDECS